MSKPRKWHAGPLPAHEQRMVTMIKEDAIYPKISHVVISHSLGFKSPPALVTQYFQHGMKVTGFKEVQLHN